MNYKYKHPAKDLSKALGLSGPRVKKIDDALLKGMDGANPNAAQLVDEITAEVAPHIKTAEEGFYAGFGLFAMLAKRRSFTEKK